MVISWSTGNAVILDEAPSNSSLPDIGSAVCCMSDLLTPETLPAHAVVGSALEHSHLRVDNNGIMCLLRWPTIDTREAQTNLAVTVLINPLYVQVYYGTQSSWYDMAASGTITHYVQTYPGATYISSFFHHVKLTGLRPDTTYFYK